MKRALILATILITSGVASAGTYLGLGVGPSVAANGNNDTLQGDGRAWHGLVGYRFGHLSLEGGFTEYGLAIDGTKQSNSTYDGTELSASLKYSIPLSAGFEAFGRGGLQHTGISNDSGAHDVSGNGVLLGLGVEYRLNFVLADASIFLDYTYSKANVTGDRDNYDFSTRIWTLGLTVGI
jgi:hypothetical protein